jgi:hypothetical protein
MNTLPKPEIKKTKSGYEIRTELVTLAKDIALQEYNYKFNNWKMSQEKLSNGTYSVTTEIPNFPGLDAIMEMSEKMYKFVETGKFEK